MSIRSRLTVLVALAAAPPAPGADPETGPAALTVSAFNQRLQNAIRGAFPDAVWVVGEIQNHDKGKGRITILFDVGTTNLDPLDAVHLSDDAASLSFELFHDGMYGPLQFDVERVR